MLIRLALRVIWRASASMSIKPCSAVEIFARRLMVNISIPAFHTRRGRYCGGEAIFMDDSERASRRGDLLSAQFQFLDDRDGCAGRFARSSQLSSTR